MADPFQVDGLGSSGINPIQGPRSAGPTGKTTPLNGKDFQSFLTESLEKVNAMSLDATEAVNRLATGQTQDVAEVFTSVQKAGVAFDLLMEIRNKLLEAYQEIQQMRV
ncbi:MAG: flagellar hook-basal body complex protein FliE [Phycisphaerae bacterium]|nr:flagellar hook-basal body complex protein FliE [Phycisphaerae bacterium]